jgi:hypothetical protein
VAEVENRTIHFPSQTWFEELAALMNGDRARYEHLGYMDCTAGFRIVGDAPFEAQIEFDEFEARQVNAVEPGSGDPDFVLAASLDTWRDMITSIAAGKGRPDLVHTLNHLSHMGTPISLLGGDMLRKDLYFRYAQSLQEFFNASHRFETTFD